QARGLRCDRLAVQVAFQVGGEIGRRGIASRTILLETFLHDRLEVARDLSIVLARALGSSLLDDEHQVGAGCLVGRAEERPEGEQLPERRAETVHVRTAIDAARGEDLLWAGISERADELSCPGDP